MPIKSTLFASLLAASAGIIMASPIIAGLSPREANNPLLLSVLFGNKLDGSEVSSDRDFGDGDPITLLADASCGRISITQIDRGNVFAQFTFVSTFRSLVTDLPGRRFSDMFRAPKFTHIYH